MICQIRHMGLDTEKLLPALSAGSGFKLRSNNQDKK